MVPSQMRIWHLLPDRVLRKRSVGRSARDVKTLDILDGTSCNDGKKAKESIERVAAVCARLDLLFLVAAGDKKFTGSVG